MRKHLGGNCAEQRTERRRHIEKHDFLEPLRGVGAEVGGNRGEAEPERRPPRAASVLIPGACDHVASHSKWDSAGVIKEVLSWGGDPG